MLSIDDRLGLQEVEGDPLGALRTDARQPTELVDQVLDDAFVHTANLDQKPSLPGSGMPGRPPPVSGAMESAASLSACALASR